MEFMSGVFWGGLNARIKISGLLLILAKHLIWLMKICYYSNLKLPVLKELLITGLVVTLQIQSVRINNQFSSFKHFVKSLP